MKKFMIIIPAAMLTLTLVLSFTLSRDFSSESKENLPPTQVAAVQSESVKKTVGYVLGMHDGKIAVFSSDGVLTRVYDVRVSTLPEYDREQLSAGIHAESLDDLRALIEDYTS